MSCNKCGPLKVCNCSCPPAPCNTAVTYFPSSAPANNTISFIPIPLIGDTGAATISVNENLTIQGVGLLKTTVTEVGVVNKVAVALTGSTSSALQKLVSSNVSAPQWVDDTSGPGGGGTGLACSQVEQVLTLSTVGDGDTRPVLRLTNPCTGNTAQQVILPDTVQAAALVPSACGSTFTLTKYDGSTMASINLGRETVKVSPVAIPGAVVGKVMPIVIAPSGNITLAQINTDAGVADFLAIIDSTTSVRVLDQGIHFVSGHGVSATLNTWFSVSRTVAGGYEDPTTYVTPGLVQNAVMVFSPNCIYVDLQEAQLPVEEVVVNACNTYTATGVGTALGPMPTNGVIPVYLSGGTLVKAVASGLSTKAQLLVVGIIDANTVTLADPGMFGKTGHGLTVGADYYLDQTTPGALVTPAPGSGVVQKILTSVTANCLSLC